jgi:hypothetical protein
MLEELEKYQKTKTTLFNYNFTAHTTTKATTRKERRHKQKHKSWHEEHAKSLRSAHFFLLSLFLCSYLAQESTIYSA